MSTPSPDAEKTARIDSDVRRPASRRGSEAQFAPGTIVAGRYRIAGILGSGGMGEVYRADDTKLGQQVALKFLPVRLARDPMLLQRLHDEVRLGRQITHPNVCRIYDIVDWEDAHFVAMEYVDGEDLSRLLRRIGRLAHDKAVEIARGIAAGLAAAHAKGILHRDLKPANVMIDSHGEARIMDFGLALAADDETEEGVISGTPAYMAPEQLAGQPATIQSDLYALGLVMYELFTGRRAHNARTLPERVRDASSEITSPSNVIRDIDPSVERIILSCLAGDPVQRPLSARAVIDALPGGDPLKMALAAGETPSPRLVAAAGTEGVLTPRAAWTMLAAIVVVLAMLIAVRSTRAVTRYTSLDRSPEVLRQRARDILRELGVPVSGAPIAAFRQNLAYGAWLRDKEQWKPLRNGPQAFAYRLEYGVTPMERGFMAPMATGPGRTTVSIDPQGRLFFLLAPPAGDVVPRPLDWRPLLAAAGLDPSRLQAIAPRHAPPAPFDTRAAWSGTYPGDATPVRIEAAAWHGRPVFFRVTGAWDETTDPLKRLPFESSAQERFYLIAFLAAVAGALLLAWRNLRLRRGDRQGALRFALAYFAIDGTGALLAADYPPKLDVLIDNVWLRLSDSLSVAALIYVVYVAFEPYVRRKWPELLIAWTRLLSGRVRDPMIGRDLLIGILAGLAHAVATGGNTLLESWLKSADPEPYLFVGWEFNSIRHMIARTLFGAVSGLRQAVFAIMILVLLAIVLRKRVLAAAGFFLLLFVYFLLAISGNPVLIPGYLFAAAIQVYVLARYGLLAFAATQASFWMLFHTMVTSATWVTALAAIPFFVVVALTLWAFRTSLGGQNPFSAGILDD